MHYWNRLKVILGSSLYIVAYACEAPKTAIDNAAIYVSEQASESRLIAQDIATTTQEPETAIRAGEIVDKQDNIIDASSEIRGNLHGVENTTPWWARSLQQFSVAIIVAGTVILLWQTGIGLFIKKIFWSFGLFIPKRALRSAEVDVKALEETHPLSYRESVAVRRSSDPAYEFALRKVRKTRR